ncbi:hypothetical protein [Paenibacillus sp.]|nr:hypothetical protein [Paenibacillus sp.]
MRTVDKSPLKVLQLINLLLAMNPRANVFWYDANGELLTTAGRGC